MSKVAQPVGGRPRSQEVVSGTPALWLRESCSICRVSSTLAEEC